MAKLLHQGLKYLARLEALKEIMVKPVPKVPIEINFEMTKVSERCVKKFGATSCVYHAHMETRLKVKRSK